MSISKIIYDPDDGSGGGNKKEELSEYEKILKKIQELNDAESEFTELQKKHLSLIATRREQQAEAANQRIKALRDYAKAEAAALAESGNLTAEKIKKIKKMTGLSEEEIDRLQKTNELQKTLLISAQELEDSEERRNKYSRETDEVMGSIAEKIGVGNSKLTKSVKKGLAFASSLRDAEFATEAINSALDAFSAQAVIGSLIENMISLATEVDKLGAEMTKTSGIGKEFESQLARVSITALDNEISLDQMSKGMLTVQQNLIESIGKSIESQEATAMQVAEFSKLGIEAESVTSMMNDMNKAMGVGTQESLDLIKDLSVSAVELGIGPKKMADGFLKASSVLSVHGKKSIDVFKGLAVAARNAGTSVDSLLSIASKFDTFSDAADAAGKLNAILGSTMSATEMLMMTEEDRIETLIKTVQSSGKQFSQMDRFKQKAIAQAAGISDMSEANRIFGMSLEAYKDQEAKAQKSEEAQTKFNEAMDNVIPIATQLAMAFQKMAVGGEFVNTVIKGMEIGLSLVQGVAWIFSNWVRTSIALIGLLGLKIAFISLQGYIAGASMAAAGAGGASGSVGVTMFGAAAELGAPGLLAFGFAALMVGAGVGFAAAGIALLVSSFAGLKWQEMIGAAGAMALLAAGIYGLGTSLSFFALPTTIFGVGTFLTFAQAVAILSVGFLALAGAFGLITNALEPMFASGEAAVEVANAVEKIGGAMSKIPDKKFFNATLENIALITTGKSAGITQAASDVRDSILKVSNNLQNNLKITLEIDGAAFNTKVLKVVNDQDGTASNYSTMIPAQ